MISLALACTHPTHPPTAITPGASLSAASTAFSTPVKQPPQPRTPGSQDYGTPAAGGACFVSISMTDEEEDEDNGGSYTHEDDVAYAGTVITRGKGLGVVLATGGHTALGRVLARARRTQPPKTELQVCVCVCVCVLLLLLVLFLVCVYIYIYICVCVCVCVMNAAAAAAAIGRLVARSLLTHTRSSTHSPRPTRQKLLKHLAQQLTFVALAASLLGALLGWLRGGDWRVRACFWSFFSPFFPCFYPFVFRGSDWRVRAFFCLFFSLFYHLVVFS